MKAALYTNPKPQYTDGNGELLSGGLLFFYQPGTTTKKDTYTTSAKSVANSNPIVLNSRGEPSVDIYLDGAYKVVLSPSTDTDPPTNAIWTVDNVTSLFSLPGTVSTKTATYTIVDSDLGSLILVDATSGAITVNLTAASTLGNGFKVSVKKSDASTNAVTIDPNSSETINGFSTLVLSDKFDCVQLVCDGSNWVTASDQRLQRKDPNNNILWEDNYAASAVNYIVHTNAATGNTPTLTLTGSDANIGVTVSTKGTSAVALGHTNASTNSNTHPLTLYHYTSSAPSAGVGTGVDFYTMNASSSTFRAGYLGWTTTSVTAGAEYSKAYLGITRNGVGNTVFYFNADSTYGATIQHKLPSDTNINIDPCHMYAYDSSTAQVVATGTNTKLTIATEAHDPYSAYATSKYTAPVTGYYYVSAQAVFSSTTTKTVFIYIQKNGTTVLDVDRGNIGEAMLASSSIYHKSTGTYLLTAGDYIEVYILHNAGVNQTVGAASLTVVKVF